jgi:hypothetical protein
MRASAPQPIVMISKEIDSGQLMARPANYKDLRNNHAKASLAQQLRGNR